MLLRSCMDTIDEACDGDRTCEFVVLALVPLRDGGTGAPATGGSAAVAAEAGANVAERETDGGGGACGP